MTGDTIFGLVAAYVVIAILLLSLNLFSRWNWWVKAAAIIVTAGFFIGSYVFTSRLLGWPTNTQLPPHFQVLLRQLICCPQLALPEQLLHQSLRFLALLQAHCQLQP